MLDTFKTSFKLRLAYTVNSTIYSLKQFPIIRKLLPNELYKSEALKNVASVIGIIFTILKELLKKFFYLFILIMLPTELYESNSTNAFIHIYVCLTIIGGFLNDYLVEPTRDKYYSIILMKMNAKEFALTEYIMKGIKQLVFTLPSMLLFTYIMEIPTYIAFLTLLFLIEIKSIAILYNLLIFDKTKKFKAQTIYSKLELIPVLLLFVGAYSLPFINILITKNIFLIILVITTILSIISIIKILKYNNYQKFFKKILTIDNIRAGEVTTEEQTSIQIAKDSIEYTELKESNKKGFAYFHDLFISRHNKILTKPVKIQSIVIIIIIIVASLVSILFPSVNKNINSIIMNYLPYFVFIMYLLNRGKSLTTAMFMNCDHSMLSYRFYRTPKVILGVFKERLKTLIIYNIQPATLIGVGLALLLFLTGGTTNNLNYIILIVSIISMSIFFSVHYLVMYYFLQPYNASTEVTSTTYSFVQSVTYLVCYYMIEFSLPTLYFGLATIIFCIAYSIISLIIAYYIAPKTFKLRQ